MRTDFNATRHLIKIIFKHLTFIYRISETTRKLNFIVFGYKQKTADKKNIFKQMLLSGYLTSYHFVYYIYVIGTSLSNFAAFENYSISFSLIMLVSFYVKGGTNFTTLNSCAFTKLVLKNLSA